MKFVEEKLLNSDKVISVRVFEKSITKSARDANETFRQLNVIKKFYDDDRSLIIISSIQDDNYSLQVVKVCTDE
jgi:hypothetical protein